MIHDHQVFEWVKGIFNKSTIKGSLGLKQVAIADYPNMPGPGASEGGIDKFLPAVLITKSDQKNTWHDIGETAVQDYFVKIKYARQIKSGDTPHLVMAVELDKVMEVLKSFYTCDNLMLDDSSVPLQMTFTGDWEIIDETAESGATQIVFGYFNILITINQTL
jgi:hypothetical protein